MRIVLDTNILVRAAVSEPSPAFELLGLIESNASLTLILSKPIIQEAENVLQRPYFLGRLPMSERLAFLELITGMASLVTPVPGSLVIQQDPADDVVLYTALAARADVICSLNVRQLSSATGARFCQQHAIRLLGDVELLDELREIY